MKPPPLGGGRSFAIFTICAFVVWLIWTFISTLQAADPGVKAVIIAFIGSVVGALYTHTQIRKREINARHFSEKRETYMKFVNFIFDFFQANSSGNPMPENEIAKRFWEFKKYLLVWGDYSVIKILDGLECQASQGNASTTFKSIDNLLNAIRKDLGHFDKDVPPYMLTLTLVRGDDRKKLLSELKL